MKFLTKMAKEINGLETRHRDRGGIMKFEDMINTIQLGDCYELIKNIPDKSIDLVYIDIPYLLGKGGGNESELSKRAKKRNNSLIDADITNGINYSIFDELCRIMKKTYIYIWCSRLQIMEILNYFVNAKKCNYEILVWCKTNPIPVTNNVYLSDLEYCLMFREKGCKLNDGYELKSKWYVSPINKTDKDLYNHPTIKPLELVKRHILHSTQPNDIVLDCFCGSGTTCVACRETGRRFIGMEIDPEYHKIAVNRLNGITANGQMSIIFDENGGKLNE